MKRYNNESLDARISIVDGKYLETRYYIIDGQPTHITVAHKDALNPLACKELFGKATKTAIELGCNSCVFDLSPALVLGQAGINAAFEGIYGGGYKKNFCLKDTVNPPMDCYYYPADGIDAMVCEAEALAISILHTRNMGNLPANMLTPEIFADKLTEICNTPGIESQVYNRDELVSLGLGGLLGVGDSSKNPPCLLVLRYSGNESSPVRLGLIGKGVTVDSGGYCLKPSSSLETVKGDMAGAATVAMTVRALATLGARCNVTAVIPMCENRLSSGSLIPGDIITSFSGKTIEVLNTDAEGRLILADGVTWAIRKEGCTHLLDIATLTGAVYALFGHVTTGVVANDDSFCNTLNAAAELSGERFWRIPTYPEYEKLIDSDLADVRNKSKNGCGFIAAALFIKRFTEGLPWLHLDIAGTADLPAPVWQHQVPGSTGTAVSTLYYLAKSMQ